MARREQDLNGADGAINGAASGPQWQHGQQYQGPQYAASAQQTGEPVYRGADRHDDEPTDAGPNLLVGRVALSDSYDRPTDRDDQIEDAQLVEDAHPAEDAQPEQDGITGTAEGLLSEEEAEEFRSRWPGIKATFVDDPHESIRHADALLREVTDLVTQRVNEERSRLAALWDGHGEVSTEDLRLALRGYQGFFDQLADAPARTDT